MTELCQFTILGYNGCKFITAGILAYFGIPIAITVIVVLVSVIYVCLTR